MTDGSEGSAGRGRSTGTGAVASLASQALSVLATRRVYRDDRTVAAMLTKLEAAVLDRDPERRLAVLVELRALGIPDAQIAEDFIPEIARKLGAAWCEDNVSFADVTIGSARLQAMVRDLSPRDADTTDGRAPLLAVIVPIDEQHTLGAMIVTAQLRRLGYSVRLFLGRDEAEVLSELSTEQFDAVLVSAAHGEKLVKLADFVKKIRQTVLRTAPIIVGGSIVARGVAVEGRVGADYITSNVVEALNQCGLKISHRDASRLATTGETMSRIS